VSLIVTAHQVPQVLGLANWSTIDGVNYARTDAPPLVRARDFVVLVAAFLAAAILSEISAWCCSFQRRWRTCGGGLRAGNGADAAGCPGGPGYRRRGAADEPIHADAAMTIRFGNQVRLASRSLPADAAS
jgi:hypothetical protein